MYGRLEPEVPLGKDCPKPTPELSDAVPTTSRTSSTDRNDQNHKKKKRRRNERDRVEMGEAEESPSRGASYSSNHGHRKGRCKRDSPCTPVHDVAVCSGSDPGDDAWDNPYVGTQKGDGGREEGQRQRDDGGSSPEPSRAREVGRPKNADRRLAHGGKDRDSRSEKKKRQEEKKNSKSLRTELSLDDHHLDPHKSENSKLGRDGEDPRHGTKKRKLKTGEKELGIHGSLMESSLWEGVTKVKKPQRKTISININLGGQLDEARKGGVSDQMAGSLVEEDQVDAGDEKVEATIEKREEVNEEDDGGIKKQWTTIPKAMEEINWGGEGIKTMERIRRDAGGEVMEEEKEELMAGVKMAEMSTAPGRGSESTSAAGETPVLTREGGSGVCQDIKTALKSLEKYSGQVGLLLPEDNMLLTQVPRSKWEQLGEEDGESGGREEPTSMEAQSAAAVGTASDSLPTKKATAAARDGGTLEDGAREPRRWETKGEKERGRTREAAKKNYREAAGGHLPAPPVSKETSERCASPADAERAHQLSWAGRGTQRTGDGQGSKDQRGQQALDKDRRREELEGRAKQSERAADGTAGAASDGQKRGPSSSRASSSSRTAGDKMARDVEDGRKRKRDSEHEHGTSTNSQSSSSRSSSSSSSSFSQPDAYSQHGRRSGSRYREHDTQPRRDRNAYETHQETPLAKPQDRQGDAEALKYRHHHPQPRRPHNQDHHHHHDHHVRDHKDHHGPPDRTPSAPQPGGRPPPPLSSGERRDPRPPFQHSTQRGQGGDPPAVGRPAPGKAVAEADRGQDKPRLDVFSRGRDALLRPRKPIDIKIISGASLFQHANLEKKNSI